jgi:hypothetical protein
MRRRWPTRTGWGSLRVWKDDEIAPDSGFPSHSEGARYQGRKIAETANKLHG